MKEHEPILATLDEYADAYCDKDIDRLMRLFVDSDEISVIGTGADELCAGTDAIRALFARNFGEATATRFEWRWRQVTRENDCAVVATTLVIHLETEQGSMSVPVRWTVCLVKQGEAWKWLHRHASAAASTQSDGAAYPSDT